MKNKVFGLQKNLKILLGLYRTRLDLARVLMLSNTCLLLSQCSGLCSNCLGKRPKEEASKVLSGPFSWGLPCGNFYFSKQALL